MSLIEKLTPEQAALIPIYREKWRKIALSTERIDKEKASQALKIAFRISFRESLFLLLATKSKNYRS